MTKGLAIKVFLTTVKMTNHSPFLEYVGENLLNPRTANCSLINLTNIVSGTFGVQHHSLKSPEDYPSGRTAAIYRKQHIYV